VDESDDEIRRRQREEEDRERARRDQELRWKRYDSPSRREIAERYHSRSGREGRWTPGDPENE
jgi:hypothetical protein